MAVEHVLIVEDDAAERLLLRSWLVGQPDAVAVAQATSLRTAIAHLCLHPVDVVLLDLGLPDSFGLPTVKAILGEARDAAIVVLSGHTDTEMALQALQVGAQDYLVKGQVTQDMLVRSMRYASERREQQLHLSRANAQLLEANRMMQRMEKARRMFVTNVSHELSNPQTAVRSSLEALEMAGPLSADQQDFLKAGLRNIQRCDTLVKTMLELARIDMGQAGLNLQTLHLPTVFAELQESFHSILKRRNMTLQCNIAAQLPTFDVDVEKIKMVLTNLVSNAIKYGPSDTSITLAADAAQGGLRLCVADCGAGLAEGEYQSVFEAFVRGKHNNAAIPGTGLGLSIVKDYVELHAGHVHAEPNQPHGCVFVVWLPRLAQNNMAELRVWEGIFYARRTMVSVAVLHIPQGHLGSEEFRLAVQEILPQLLRQGDRITYHPHAAQAIVVLIDTDRIAAMRVASKIKEGMLPRLPQWEAQHIGLAVFPEDGSTPQEILAAARGTKGAWQSV